MRKTFFRILFAIALIGVALAPRLAAAQKLIVGWSAVSALNSPYWVMQDGGFLRQEGVETDLIYIASSSTIAQGQLAGDFSVSTANSQGIADIGLQGGELIAMGAVINVAAFYIMAAPDIKRVEDLRGKPVGVTRYGARSEEHTSE